MLLYAFLLIVLLRPSYGLLNFFTLVFGVLYVGFNVALYATQSGPYAEFPEYAAEDFAPRLALSAAINLGLFYAVGLVIVFLRTRGKKKADESLDAEMERIRAEIATRERGDPPATL